MKNLKNLLQQLLMFAKILGLVFDTRWDSLRASVPAYKQACDDFKLLVAEINSKIASYHFITRGITAQKRTARLSLSITSYSIISSARSWGIKNGKTEIAAKLKVSYLEILKMTYKDFMPFIENSIALIQPLVPQLAAFNVTPQNFSDWSTQFSDFKTINTSPQSAIKERKTLGTVIVNDTKTAMDFLNNQITPLVSNFQSTPEFFIGFYNAKKIGLPNIHHTRLLAHCTDELGKPIYAAIVTVDQFTDPNTGKKYPAVSSITHPNGDAEVIEFFAGNRTVTIMGKDIVATTFSAHQFQSGKPVSKTYILKPAFTNIPAPQDNKEKVNN